MERSLIRASLARVFANAPKRELSFTAARAAVLVVGAMGLLGGARREPPGGGALILWSSFAFYSILWTVLLVGFSRAARAVVAAGAAVDLAFLALGIGTGGICANPAVITSCLAAGLYGFYFGLPLAPLIGVAVGAAFATGPAWAGDALARPSFAFSETAILAFSILFGWLSPGSKPDEKRPQKGVTASPSASDAAKTGIGSKQADGQNGDGAEPIGSARRLSIEIAHQMRDPLNLMSLNLEMLQEELRHAGVELKPEVADILSAMEKTVKSLSDISENCLQFARLPRPVLRSENLKKLLEEILVATQPALSRMGITCTADLTSEVPEIPFDRRQIKFALENILQNAREAMPGGGRLRISLAAENGSVNVAIADTGPGIAPELCRDIFEPFFSTKPLGTGLGLSLAKRVVESHGGRLTVKSIVSVGSTFTLVLPIRGRCAHE